MSDSDTENPNDRKNMTENTDNSIRDELNMIMPGSEPLGNLKVVQTGPVHYSVLSARNGSVSVQRVDIQNVECSCADMTHNTDRLTSTDDEGREICSHLAAAMMEHPQLDADGMALYDMMGVTQSADRVIRELEEERGEIEQTLIQLRDTAAGQAAGNDASSDESGTTSDNSQSPPGSDVDVDAAVDRLQAAYDDVINDMQVQAHEGWVWVQTGRDTPDTLPGPGNVEVFSAFLQNADAVEFVHDDHDDVNMKPGEWWKNRIAPEAVDDYIQEVLE